MDLVNDAGRSEWINYEASMIPLMLRVVEERPGSIAEPIDYDSLLDDREFRTALLRTKARHDRGHGGCCSPDRSGPSTNRGVFVEGSLGPVRAEDRLRAPRRSLLRRSPEIPNLRRSAFLG